MLALLMILELQAARADDPCPLPTQLALRSYEGWVSEAVRVFAFAEENERRARALRNPTLIADSEVAPAQTPAESLMAHIRVRQAPDRETIVEIDPPAPGVARSPSAVLRGSDRDGVYQGEAEFLGRLRLSGSLDSNNRVLIVQRGEVEVWRMALPRDMELRGLVGQTFRFRNEGLLRSAAAGPEAAVRFKAEGPRRVPLLVTVTAGTEFTPRSNDAPLASPTVGGRFGFEF
jgi:hypothetical protein